MNKRKLQLSSIDIMGIIGFLIWIITLFLRRYYLINSILPIFCVAPNFGGAWVATAVIKQAFSPIYSQKKVINKDFSKKILFFICVTVVIMVLVNEMLVFINTSQTVDMYDVLATIIAEIIIFSIPVALKEKVLIDFR